MATVVSELASGRAGITGKVRTGRPDQLTVLGFVTDVASEVVLRDGLNDLSQTGIQNTCDIRRGSVKVAAAAMMRMPAPQILVVDIGGEDRPLQALLDLCDLIEPSISVLVIGEIDDLDLYRAINRRIGAIDYFFKPITREIVARHFASLISNDSHMGDATRGGRVVAITGARGGVGASTITHALAWFLGVDANRHTVLLDADPFIGAAQDRFGTHFTPSLRKLLADETEIDPGVIVGAAKQIQNRLHVLGSPADPGGGGAAAGAARRIVDALRFRFNFVVIDLPYLPIQSHRELLESAHHRVIVLDPSVAGLRDTLRILAIPNGPGQPQRPTILLNRNNRPGGLRRKQIEDALKRKIDLVMDDLPKPFAAIAAQTPFGGVAKGPLNRLIHDVSREIGFEPNKANIEGAALRNFQIEA